MNTDGSGVWWMISLAGVGCGGSQVTQHLFVATLGLPTNLGEG